MYAVALVLAVAGTLTAFGADGGQLERVVRLQAPASGVGVGYMHGKSLSRGRVHEGINSVTVGQTLSDDEHGGDDIDTCICDEPTR